MLRKLNSVEEPVTFNRGMKKYLFLVICVAAMTACDNELEEVFIQYEISAAKDEKKKDVNFLIHNDHYQKGKEETK